MPKKSILIVDDEEAIRSLLVSQLDDAGYDVNQVDDGEKAISQLKAKPYNLVLLDIKMPNLDGMDVLKYIQKNFPSVKVIMLTGYATLKYAMESKELGAIDFITKPFNLTDVLTTIECAIGK